MRDVKIAAIYEGTNGIQALDLVGRKLGANKGANVMNLAGEIMATIGKAKASKELGKYAGKLETAGNALIDLTMAFAGYGKSSSFLLPVLNASTYLEIFGDVVLGWLLTQGALIAEEKLVALYEANGADTVGKQRALVHTNPEVAFYQGKIASAKFFAVEMLSTVKARCELIKEGEKVPIEIADECFSA
jgi:hypothetical protein